MIKGIVVGLTGQTGAGKTTVANKLKQFDYVVIDCDKLAREVTQKGAGILDDLKTAFGEDIVDENGELIRSKLAEKAFATPEDTQKLNAITHPKIIELTVEMINYAFTEGFNAVVVDAPALFESGLDDKCDITVSVIAPLEVRLNRIMQRDEINADAAMLRINAQQSEEYYIEKSDIIIENGNSSNLDEQVSVLKKRIEEMQDE